MRTARSGVSNRWAGGGASIGAGCSRNRMAFPTPLSRAASAGTSGRVAVHPTSIDEGIRARAILTLAAAIEGPDFPPAVLRGRVREGEAPLTNHPLPHPPPEYRGRE